MTLSPEDFENIVADLLSREWNVKIELFKNGKDNGIDLRSTRVLGSPSITIIQCKRYSPHRFTELVRAVKSERKKIERLKPARYVLATSVPLSPDNKKILIEILAPWCHSTDDIYGTSELNALLRIFPEVEKAHFKLWIGSTAVLERILHSRIFNITQATLESIRTQLSRLVVHKGYDRAMDILRQDHHVLIVGNPGIGKSTLAKMILCHYLREGFQPICVTGNIDDAWSLVQMPAEDKRKFVVLYDDFLGRYRFESLHFGKNEELSLFEFLDKVRRSPNIRFLLTTREYILADAQRMHGAFAERAQEILKYTLKLEDYSKAHRAKMLFNHLYFSDLPVRRLELLVKDRVYKTIVEHKHFNPRNVETISNYANSRAMTDGEYLSFVKHEFSNPARLWEHPFRQDIGSLARMVLMILWTFGEPVDLETLKKATKQFTPDGEESDFGLHFTDALRQLDGNFIATTRYRGITRKSGHFIVAQFSNASIEEFVDGFLRSDASLIERLTKSIVCFRQVDEMFTQVSGKKTHSLSPSFWKSLRETAVFVEKVPGGHVVNYRSSGARVRRVWTERNIDWPDQTRVRLQIEAEARQSDAISEDLQRRVTTVGGWRFIIAGSRHDAFQGWHIKSLNAWITKESGWPRSIIDTCRGTFRQAVFQSLTDEDDLWIGSIDSLQTLADVVLSSGASLNSEEKIAFHEAGKLAVEALVESAETADEIQEELSDLEQLAKLCSLDFTQEIAELGATADGLEERWSSDESYDPESSHISNSTTDEEFDLDALFAGLLDR
jgi:hypothetical protein